MLNHTHTTFILMLKKKKDHEVFCARIINLKKKTQGNTGKFKVTQERFFDSESGNPGIIYKLRFSCFARSFFKLNSTFR